MIPARFYKVKLSLTILFICCMNLGVKAQADDVSVTVMLYQPYPIQLDYYLDNPGTMALELTNTGEPIEDYSLEFEVNRFENTIITATSDLIMETLGVIPVLKTIEDVEGFDFKLGENANFVGLNSEQINRIENDRILPEGVYVICVYVYDDADNLRGMGCSEDFTIVAPERPVIYLPEDGSTVFANPIDQVQIGWFESLNPVPDLFFNTLYRLKIIDLSDADLPSPIEAMFDPGTPVVLEIDDLIDTDFLMEDIDLIEGHTYAVRVTAYDEEELIDYQYGGHSEVITFVYQGLDDEEEPSDDSFAEEAVAPLLIDWENIYGGEGDEVIHKMIETSTGKLVAVGETTTKTLGGKDGYLLIMEAASGTPLVSKNFGGAQDDGFTSIIEDGDGNLVVVGHTQSKGNGGADAWLLHITENGEVIWQDTYGTTGQDEFQYIVQGSWLVAGLKNGRAEGDIWLASLNDSTYVQNWEKLIGQDALQDITGLIKTEKGLALTGNALGSERIWFAQTDATGNLLQGIQFFGGQGEQLEATDLIQTLDGGFAISGGSKTGGDNNRDMLLLKLNGQGEKQWSKTYGGKADDLANSLAQSTNGNFALTGKTRSHQPNARTYSLIVLTTDPDGIPLPRGERTYGGLGNDEGVDILHLIDNSLSIAGVTESKGQGEKEAWILKFQIPDGYDLPAEQVDVELGDLEFIEPNGNKDGQISSGESGFLSFKFSNNSPRPLLNNCLRIKSDKFVPGLEYQTHQPIRFLKKGMGTLQVPLTAHTWIRGGSSQFEISFQNNCLPIKQTLKTDLNSAGTAGSSLDLFTTTSHISEMTFMEPDEKKENISNCGTTADSLSIYLKTVGNFPMARENIGITMNDEPMDNCFCATQSFNRQQAGNNYFHYYRLQIPLAEGKNKIGVQVKDVKGKLVREKSLIARKKNQLHVVMLAPDYGPSSGEGIATLSQLLYGSSQENPLYRKVVEVEKMDGSQVSLAAVTNAFEKLKFRYQNFSDEQSIKDRDLVLVYIAARGQMKNGQLHFELPNTATGITQWISYQSIVDNYLDKIQAKKLVWVNPCVGTSAGLTSSQIADALKSDYDDLVTFSKCQISSPAGQLPYDAFTYALVQGLNGYEYRDADGIYRADTNGNKFISMGELANFMDRRLDDLAEKENLKKGKLIFFPPTDGVKEAEIIALE